MSGFRGCQVAEDAGRTRHGQPPRVQRGRARTSTPMVTLVVRAPGSTHRLSLKLEAYNPTGSINFDWPSGFWRHWMHGSHWSPVPRSLSRLPATWGWH